MRILIDIGHPGHVHLFRHFAKEMTRKGNKVLFTCRQKEFEIELLKAENFEYISFGKHYNTKLGKIWGLIKFDVLMCKTAFKFRPNIFISHGSMYAAHGAFMIRKPHIALEDSENIEQIILYKPFTKKIVTPNAIPMKYGVKQISYEGFHQSAYLHPNYFTKNSDYKLKLGLEPDSKIFMLRLVALNASHDLRIKSIDKTKLIELIKFLKTKGNVFISSEKPLINELQEYKLSIPPEEIHEFMSVCDLIVGESGAMTNEAAYLGIPNVLIADVDLNVHKKYVDLGLKIHHKFLDDLVLENIKLIVKDLDNYKEQFSFNAKEYKKRSIDLTEFIINIVESEVN